MTMHDRTVVGKPHHAHQRMLNAKTEIITIITYSIEYDSIFFHDAKITKFTYTNIIVRKNGIFFRNNGYIHHLAIHYLCTCKNPLPHIRL